MSRIITLYLRDILQNMQDTQEFVAGLSYEGFVRDKKTLNAVVRSIEIIGEAAKNIPDGVRSKYTDIPWKEMAGMRDLLIHFYFGVDPEAVWIAVKERIPVLMPVIERILQEISKEQ
jgi:uncharacterized protein with HEPN domain